MIRTKLAKKVLTKAEQRHLTKDANVHSMEAFVRTIEFQRKCDEENRRKGINVITCLTCKHIAAKLGV